MSFKPDDITHESYVEDLLEEQITLLKALIILISEAADEDPLSVIDSAEQLT